VSHYCFTKVELFQVKGTHYRRRDLSKTWITFPTGVSAVHFRPWNYVTRHYKNVIRRLSVRAVVNSFQSSVVSVTFVPHCLNRSTDLHAIWQVHLLGPMTHCVWWGPWAPREERKIWGQTPQPKHAIANCCCHLANSSAAIPPIGKLLWFLYMSGSRRLWSVAGSCRQNVAQRSLKHAATSTRSTADVAASRTVTMRNTNWPEERCCTIFDTQNCLLHATVLSSCY